VFQEDVAKFLFEKCMTRDEHVRDLSKTGLSCMLTYFKFSNLSLGKLRLNDDVDYDCEVVSSDVNKLEGWSLLWNVALNARDEDVANLAIRFVVHTIAPENKDTLSEFWVHCTRTCVKHLKTSHRQNENTTTSRRVRRCVVALQLLLKNSAQESKGRLKSHEESCLHSGGDGDNLILLKIRNNVKESATKQMKKEIQMFETKTVSELCDKVASCVEMPVCRLRIFACGKELTRSRLLSHTLHSTNIRSGTSILVVSRPKDESKQQEKSETLNDETKKKIELQYLPGTILCDDENLMETLFDLLDKSQCSKMTSSIWTLLMTLPSSPKLLKSLKSLQDVSSLQTAIDGTSDEPQVGIFLLNILSNTNNTQQQVHPYFVHCTHFKS